MIHMHNAYCLTTLHIGPARPYAPYHSTWSILGLPAHMVHIHDTYCLMSSYIGPANPSAAHHGTQSIQGLWTPNDPYTWCILLDCLTYLACASMCCISWYMMCIGLASSYAPHTWYGACEPVCCMLWYMVHIRREPIWSIYMIHTVWLPLISGLLPIWPS